MTGEVLVLALYALDMAQPEDIACAIYILLHKLWSPPTVELLNNPAE